MAAERERTRFDHTKSERELGIRFRPVEETFRDVVSWYRDNHRHGKNCQLFRQPTEDVVDRVAEKARVDSKGQTVALGSGSV